MFYSSVKTLGWLRSDCWFRCIDRHCFSFSVQVKGAINVSSMLNNLMDFCDLLKLLFCKCVYRSAFFFFCNEERPKVRAVYPSYGVGDIAKELGKRWEVCPNKPKFDSLAAKDKQRYEQVGIYCPNCQTS